MTVVSSSTVIAITALIGGLLSSLALPSYASTPETECPRTMPSPGPLTAAQFENGPIIAKADLTREFDGWIASMRALNADLTIRADPARLDRMATVIRRSLKKPMSRRDAWKQFALLNPVLRDAHAGIQMPGYREALQAHMREGGRMVPIDVRFGPDGALQVFAVPTASAGVKVGDRVEAINGHSTSAMVREMLRRSIGETDLLRHAWVARRFAMLYWYLYGDTGRYDLKVRSALSDCSRLVRMDGGTVLPFPLQPDPQAKDAFAWRIIDGDIGYLRADGFDLPLKDALAAFAKTAFAAFSEAHIRSLIIDVRENGGGDDPLWQQSLMKYIKATPHAQLSKYVQRVTQSNADPGDVVGSLKRGDYQDRFTPSSSNPIRFSGPVYILVGPYTYSAAIQFVVAAQDFRIAKIAGAETGALSCQTGQVQRIPMAKTGLSASTPTIAYVRPSGSSGCHRGVIPDVAVPIDEVAPDNTLDALLRRISSGSARDDAAGRVENGGVPVDSAIPSSSITACGSRSSARQLHRSVRPLDSVARVTKSLRAFF